MTSSRLMMIGVACFLAGGAMLAFVDGTTGTALGTVFGVAGLGLAGLGWMKRRGGADGG